jgi:hypothetical protein
VLQKVAKDFKAALFFDIITFMKRLIILSFIIFYFSIDSYALTLVLNSAKENKEEFALLHLINKEPMKCYEVIKEPGKKAYICKFNKILSNPIRQKDTKFFNIDFLQKEDEFYIKIEPKYNSYLFPVTNDLSKENEVTKKSGGINHWVVVAFINKAPFISRTPVAKGINFPIFFTSDLHPSVGALDLNGEPISYAKGKDINLYLNIKKEYRKKNYKRVIDKVDKTLKKYDDTIFKSELLLYKLRALDKMAEDKDKYKIDIDEEMITELGKKWVKSFPSDEAIAEVLLYIAKAYLRIGYNSDANYFLDVLMSEHPKSKFAKMGAISFADNLYKKGKKAKAIALYKDVLYSAKDIDVASLAAMRLANNSAESRNFDKAAVYYQKILDANEEFILKDKQKAYELAKKLASNKLEKIASQISLKLLKRVKKIDPIYEELLKDSGVWAQAAKDNKKAYELYKRYIEEFPYGEFKDFVTEKIDRLLFETEEKNETKLMMHYEHLIKNYKGDAIYDKAVVEKAKLLLKQKKYKDVLSMKEELIKAKDANASEAKQTLNKAALSQMILNLKNDKCKDALWLIDGFGLKIPPKHEDALYTCYSRLSKHKKAFELAQKHLKQKDLKKRLAWMSKALNSLIKLRRYKEALTLGKDIEALRSIVKTDKYKDTIYQLFEAYAMMQDSEGAIKTAKKIADEFKDNFRSIEVYDKVINIAKKDRNDLLIVDFAKKAITLQQKRQSYPLSPKVEFDYIDSLKRLNKEDEALKVVENLLSLKLKDDQKARALYAAGELGIKLNKPQLAKKYFGKCIKLKNDSSWKGLCKEGMNLVD